MSPTNATNSSTTFKVKNAASTLSSHERKDLAVHALSGKSTITSLAEEANTSRKFIYSQKNKATEALDAAFSEEKRDEGEVLFYLPVTKGWLKQLVIALILICHSSYQGVIEIFRDLLNVEISKGGIHNSPYALTVRGEFCYFDFQWFTKSVSLFTNRLSIF